jgi:hypothetical protein
MTVGPSFCLSLMLPIIISLQLKADIEALNLQPIKYDEWFYIWGFDCFSSHRAYIHLQSSHPASPLFKWMWKSKVQNKHKFCLCTSSLKLMFVMK